MYYNVRSAVKTACLSMGVAMIGLAIVMAVNASKIAAWYSSKVWYNYIGLVYGAVIIILAVRSIRTLVQASLIGNIDVAFYARRAIGYEEMERGMSDLVINTLIAVVVTGIHQRATHLGISITTHHELIMLAWIVISIITIMVMKARLEHIRLSYGDRESLADQIYYRLNHNGEFEELFSAMEAQGEEKCSTES